MLSPSIIKQYMANMPKGTISTYLKMAKSYFEEQMPEAEKERAAKLATDLSILSSGLSTDALLWVVCVVGEPIVKAVS
jgi:hypothetical protein